MGGSWLPTFADVSQGHLVIASGLSITNRLVRCVYFIYLWFFARQPFADTRIPPDTRMHGHRRIRWKQVSESLNPGLPIHNLNRNLAVVTLKPPVWLGFPRRKGAIIKPGNMCNAYIVKLSGKRRRRPHTDTSNDS